MASMVTRSPTWPQRRVPPFLTWACDAVGCAAAAGVETLAVVGAAAGLAAAAAEVGAAAAGGCVATGGDVGAAGAEAGPHAASRPAPMAEPRSASAERRVSSREISDILFSPWDLGLNVTRLCDVGRERPAHGGAQRSRSEDVALRECARQLYALIRRGSKASRSASVSKLRPRRRRARATPGKMPNQGAVRR